MARPPKHPVDVKLQIVLPVLAGESTQAEAARRHGISETSIGKWKEQVLCAGREGLERGDRAGRPSGREARLLEEVDDLTRALGEAHVELRALKRGGPAGRSFRWAGAAAHRTRPERSAVLQDRRAAGPDLLRPPRPPPGRRRGARSVADAGPRWDPRRGDRARAEVRHVGAPQDRVAVPPPARHPGRRRDLPADPPRGRPDAPDRLRRRAPRPRHRAPRGVRRATYAPQPGLADGL